MRTTPIFWRALLAFVLLSLPGTVQAITVYHMAGTVSVVGSNLGTVVTAGDSFQVDFTYDESIPAWGNFGNQKLYNLQSTELTIHATGGDLTWAFSTPSSDNTSHGFSVENNNSNRDAFILNTPGHLAMTGPSLNGKDVTSTVFTLIDGTQTAFSSTDYPTSLDPSWFTSQLLDLRFTGQVPGQDIINFNVTSMQINPSAVPEPSTYALLFGLGVLGLAVWRRRRV